MTRFTLPIVALLAVAVLAGTVGPTVLATGRDSGDPGSSFLRYLHQLGHRLHGGAQHHDSMAQLIDQLELTPDQLQSFATIHRLIGAQGQGEPGAMIELHNQLVAQFERGHLTNDEIRQAIDRHVEQMRHTAYAVTDELVVLLNGLDSKQRQVLLEHLQGGGPTQPGNDHGHGHGH